MECSRVWLSGSRVSVYFILIAVMMFSASALSHEVSGDDVKRILDNTGTQIGLYAWLGAKHMVTGYDHLAFLVGVVFYLRHYRSVVLFVSLFALGHTITLISGVLLGLDVNPYFVDTVIGFSVVYKAFDNLKGFETVFGTTPPDERVAVFLFGLFHGLGLATKLQDLGISNDGLVINLVSFNLGVELGQVAALLIILAVLRFVPSRAENAMIGTAVNAGLMVAGFALMAYHLVSYTTLIRT